jgi:chromosome segregation ATPase
MKDKELYERKIQAQLDEWRADLDKLKARAAQASADSQLEMNRRIENAESRIAEGKAKLEEVRHASDEAWGSLREGVESAWESIATGFRDAASKLRDRS